MATATQERVVAKSKKGARPSDTKRYGTLIRVSDDFAEAIRKAAGAESLTVGEFATKYLQGPTEKRYRDAILKEAKRLESDSNAKS